MDLDDDGYPTEELLARIAAWEWQRFGELVDLLPSIWKYAEAGYFEIGEIREEGEPRKRLHLSTAGWSGNESIIQALQRNRLFWLVGFEEHRRGGHYIFDLERLLRKQE